MGYTKASRDGKTPFKGTEAIEEARKTKSDLHAERTQAEEIKLNLQESLELESINEEYDEAKEKRDLRKYLGKRLENKKTCDEEYEKLRDYLLKGRVWAQIPEKEQTEINIELEDLKDRINKFLMRT